MHIDDLFKHFGSRAAAAQQLRCSYVVFSKWKVRYGGKVPWPWQCVAFYASKGKLKPEK